MKNQLLAAGVLLFVGVILVPVSVIYLKDTLPFAVIASCLAGVVAYLYFGDKARNVKAQAASVDAVREAINVVSEKLASLNTAVSTVSENERLTKDSVVKALGEMTENIKNQISSQSSELIRNQQAVVELLGMVQTAAGKVIDNIGRNNTLVGDSMGRIMELMTEAKSANDRVAGDVIQRQEMMLGTFAALNDGMKALGRSQTDVLSSMDGIEKALSKSMQYMIDGQNSMIKTSDQLSSSINRFLNDHDEIQKTLNSTANDLLSLQAELQEMFRSQASVVDGVMRTFMDSFTSNVSELTENFNSKISKLKSEISDSTEELKDGLKDSVEKIEEGQFDLMDKLETFTAKVSDCMKELEKGVKMHDDKLSRLSACIPKLQELNSSEEKMMKELEEICRSRR